MNPTFKALFLLDYETICRKYGIVVNSCGCCNSPWLTELEDLEYNYFKHIKESCPDNSKIERE